MEYEMEDRPLQMGEDRHLHRPFGLVHPIPPISFSRLRPETRDRAILIPEQEPIS
jgi:hypothetical protein